MTAKSVGLKDTIVTDDGVNLPITDAIIAYEGGELDELEVIELFQKLVNSGLAWRLQGHYGRTAQALIDEGRIKDNHRISL